MLKDDILAAFDEGMADAPFPVTADDPRGSVFLALRELIANSDTGGVFSVTFSPHQPIGFEEIGSTLIEPGASAAEALNVSASYTPN